MSIGMLQGRVSLCSQCVEVARLIGYNFLETNLVPNLKRSEIPYKKGSSEFPPLGTLPTSLDRASLRLSLSIDQTES